MLLGVWINDTETARIERREDGRVEFSFLESYRRLRRRPVLGAYYLDKLARPPDPSLELPNFFANLLPEGRLRRLIVDAAGIREGQDMRLLAHIGEDLPGAVIVRLLTDSDDSKHIRTEPEATRTPLGDKLRFSLAGVQLKFSVLRADKRLTLPASGRGGDWIVKLPDADRPGLPENEFAVMSWARESGISVPEFEIVTYADLEGLNDRRFIPDGELCFAIRRFDRPTPGLRIHIEDFAQVNNLHPLLKYDEHAPIDRRVNYETVANQILTLCGAADLREFVRRLVFTVLSGNADAHLKNWSLIYPDGRTPRLSPAYDQVATIAYHNTSEELALPFQSSVSFEAVTVAGFRDLASKLRRDPDEMARWAKEDVAQIMDAWTTHQRTLPLSPESRYFLDLHHKRLRAAADSLLK